MHRCRLALSKKTSPGNDLRTVGIVPMMRAQAASATPM